MDSKIFVTQSSMPPYEEYIQAIKPLWDSCCLTNMGQYHQELEAQLKDYLGVPGLSLMVNGHMSLELALQAFGFPEDAEVITTPYTFISTTHAIVRNHLKPVFCDVKLGDGCIDESKIEDLITEKTVAILPLESSIRVRALAIMEMLLFSASMQRKYLIRLKVELLSASIHRCMKSCII